jgi:hypothetical protein
MKYGSYELHASSIKGKDACLQVGADASLEARIGVVG